MDSSVSPGAQHWPAVLEKSCKETYAPLEMEGAGTGNSTYSFTSMALVWLLLKRKFPRKENSPSLFNSLPWVEEMKKEMATHSSILAWEIPWTEEPGRLQSMELQRIWHNLATEHQQQQPWVGHSHSAASGHWAGVCHPWFTSSCKVIFSFSLQNSFLKGTQILDTLVEEQTPLRINERRERVGQKMLQAGLVFLTRFQKSFQMF